MGPTGLNCNIHHSEPGILERHVQVGRIFAYRTFDYILCNLKATTCQNWTNQNPPNPDQLFLTTLLFQMKRERESFGESSALRHISPPPNTHTHLSPSTLCSIRPVIGPAPGGLQIPLAEPESAAADLTGARERAVLQIKAAGFSSSSSGSRRPENSGTYLCLCRTLCVSDRLVCPAAARSGRAGGAAGGGAR